MGTNFDFVGDILNRYANNTPPTSQQTNNKANNEGANENAPSPANTQSNKPQNNNVDTGDFEDDDFELSDDDFDLGDDDFSTDDNSEPDIPDSDDEFDLSDLDANLPDVDDSAFDNSTGTGQPQSNNFSNENNSFENNKSNNNAEGNTFQNNVDTPPVNENTSGMDFSNMDGLFEGLDFSNTEPPVVDNTESGSTFNNSATNGSSVDTPPINSNNNNNTGERAEYNTSTGGAENNASTPDTTGTPDTPNTDDVVEPVPLPMPEPTPIGSEEQTEPISKPENKSNTATQNNGHSDFSFLDSIFSGIDAFSGGGANVDNNVDTVSTANDATLTDIPDDITALELLKEFINPNTKYTSIDFTNYARLHTDEFYDKLPKTSVSWGKECDETYKALDTLGKAHLLEAMHYSPVRKPLITLFLENKPTGVGLAVALLNLYYNVASQNLERLKPLYGRVQTAEKNAQLLKLKGVAWGHNRYWSIQGRPDMCINTKTDVQDIIRKNIPVPTNEYSQSAQTNKNSNPYDKPISTRTNYSAKEFVRLHTVYKVPIQRFVEYNESYNIMKHLLNNNINWRTPKIEHIYLAGRAHFLEIIGVLPRYHIVTKSQNPYLTAIINAYYTGELEYDTIPSKKLFARIVNDTISEGRYWGYSKSDGVGSANFEDGGVEPIAEYSQGIEDAVPVIDTSYEGTADSIKIDKLNGIVLNPRKSQQVKLVDAGSVARPDLSARGIGVNVRNWMFNSFKGTSYVFDRYWKAILDEIDRLYKGDRRQVKMIAFVEDSVIVGNKFVSVEELTRGPGGAELCDIINLRSLFKRYKNLEQIVFDMNCVYCIEEQYAVNAKDGYKSSVKNMFLTHEGLKCIGVLGNGDSTPSMTYRKDLDLEIAMDEVDIVSDTITKKRRQNEFRTACAKRDPNIAEKSPGTLMRISKGTAEHGMQFGSSFFNDLKYDENGKSHPVRALWHGSIATAAFGIAAVAGITNLVFKGAKKVANK